MKFTLIVLFLLTAALSTQFLYHKSIYHFIPLSCPLRSSAACRVSHPLNLHIPSGGMNCPPLTVCSASSLSIFFSLKVIYTDVIFHSSWSSRYLKNHRLQGHSRHKHLHYMVSNQLPLKREFKQSRASKSLIFEGKTVNNYAVRWKYKLKTILCEFRMNFFLGFTFLMSQNKI